MERIQVVDVALIGELWKEFAASAIAGDLERWLALWTEDGIQLPPGAPRRAGKAEIRHGMEPSFNLFDAHMAVRPDEIHVVGDLAYTHGAYEYVFSPKDGGEPLQGIGKFLTILRRQPEGTWKIAVDCFNSDAPTA